LVAPARHRKEMTVTRLSLLLGLGVMLLTGPATGQSTWQLRSPLPTSNGLMSVTYGNDLFVAVGFFDTILTSPDAVTWSLRSQEGQGLLTDVAFGNGTFVAIGVERDYAPRTTVIRTSRDAINWTNGPVQPDVSLVRIGFINDVFVAVGGVSEPAGVGRAAILTSSDGQVWTERWRSTTDWAPSNLNSLWSFPCLISGDHTVLAKFPGLPKMVPRSRLW